MIRRYQGPYEPDHWLYRPVWLDPWNHGRYVCYPVGIHFVAIFLHWLWLKTYWYPFGYYDREIHTAYARGKAIGKSQGSREERRYWATIKQVPPLDTVQKMADALEEDY